jgi:hypothetical protein
VALLLLGTFLGAAAAAFLALVLAVALASGHGAGVAGDRMLLVLGFLGLLFLGSLPLVFLFARRWTGRPLLAAALAATAGLGNGIIWLGAALAMAVVLNR